jgi:hypothetical protein
MLTSVIALAMSLVPMAPSRIALAAPAVYSAAGANPAAILAKRDELRSVLGGGTAYSTIFQTFSAQRLFSPLGSNIVDLTFFVPGSGGFHFGAAAYSAGEASGSASITVLRTGNVASPALVDYATSDGTASAGADYISASGQLLFGSGEISKTFTVTILNDALAEDIETLNLTLSNPAGGILVVPSTAVLTIADDERPPASIFAITNTNNLLRFSSASPGTVSGVVAITGLQTGETILGIDFRPASGQLYALGSTSRLYTIDSTTGAATVVSASPFATALSGTSFGFDVNPVADRLRVVSDADQNLRLNPNNGALAALDSPLAYAAADLNAGANPNIVGAAYSNNFAGATSTTLYVLDSNLDILGIQNPPNSGMLNTVGLLGVDTSAEVGFDIAPRSGTALASLTVGGSAQLYTINLTTGAANLIGPIGSAQQIRDIAVAPAKLVYLSLVRKP